MKGDYISMGKLGMNSILTDELLEHFANEYIRMNLKDKIPFSLFVSVNLYIPKHSRPLDIEFD